MTGIPYCDETWNVVAGCARCSEGCRNCWAIRTVNRLQANPKVGSQYQGLVETRDGRLDWTGEVRTLPERLGQPRQWKYPRRIFCCSQSDLFHPKVPVGFIDEVLEVMASTPQHTYLVLTKRAHLLERRLYWPESEDSHPRERYLGGGDFQPNLWLGMTVCNQHEMDIKGHYLREVPAALRWLSLEPLLGPVSVPDWVDWVVVGCESGPERRPCDIEWVRDVVRQCQEMQIPVYVKQVDVGGVVASMEHKPWLLMDSRPDLLLHQFPPRATDPALQGFRREVGTPVEAGRGKED